MHGRVRRCEVSDPPEYVLLTGGSFSKVRICPMASHAYSAVTAEVHSLSGPCCFSVLLPTGAFFIAPWQTTASADFVKKGRKNADFSYAGPTIAVFFKMRIYSC